MRVRRFFLFTPPGLPPVPGGEGTREWAGLYEDPGSAWLRPRRIRGPPSTLPSAVTGGGAGGSEGTNRSRVLDNRSRWRRPGAAAGRHADAGAEPELACASSSTRSAGRTSRSASSPNAQSPAAWHIRRTPESWTAGSPLRRRSALDGRTRDPGSWRCTVSSPPWWLSVRVAPWVPFSLPPFFWPRLPEPVHLPAVCAATNLHTGGSKGPRCRSHGFRAVRPGDGRNAAELARVRPTRSRAGESPQLDVSMLNFTLRASRR